MKILHTLPLALALLLCSCSRAGASGADSAATAQESRSQASPFCADSAMSLVRAQVAMGPRVPGSPAHAACADFLAARLRALGGEVGEQRASLRAYDGSPLPMRNILARFRPDSPDRVLLLAHYDSRPWADHDPVEINRTKPVPAANDGASGPAVILELLRALEAQGYEGGIDVLFTDAEDYGSEGDDSSWALGARYFADHLPWPGYSPRAAILLDMVGGEGSVFAREYFSQEANPALMQELWSAAARAGASSLFVDARGGAITDDHLELQRIGIPCVDIIGTSPQGGFLPTWHTLSDTPEHISPATLRGVGRTLLEWFNPATPSI